MTLIINSLTDGHLQLLEAVRGYVTKLELDWQVQVQSVQQLDPQATDTWWVTLQRVDVSNWSDLQRSRLIQLFGDQTGACLHVDLQACALVAVQHMQQQGFREIGVIDPGHSGNERQQTFVRAMKQACEQQALSLNCHHHTAYQELPQLVTWLKTVKHPLAICCFADGQAAWLHRLCREHGLGIPDDVALLGLGDVPERCLAFDPALSSIALPWKLMGTTLAHHLHLRISGGSTPTPQIIRPFRVVARASTQALPITDPLVRQAQHWLSNHLVAPQPLRAVAAHCGCSMQTLCVRFRESLGTTPKQVHDRLRCHAAVKLLENSTLPIATMGKQAGFTSPTSFGIAFKRRFGCSPRHWRQQYLSDNQNH